MMSTFARAAALLTAALLVGSSATAATAAVGGQVRTSTVTAGELVTAGEGVAKGAAAAVTMTSKRKPKPAKGFHVVKELPRFVYSGFSPAKGELWLATAADNGTGQLNHLRAGRWTTQTMPVYYGSSFTGTSRDDVWLASGAFLRRYDGRRWGTVALPTLAPGVPPWLITAVESPRRGVLYAALSGDDGFGNSQVFRYAKGRWTALGAPDPHSERHQVAQMKVVDGALLTRSVIDDGDAFESYASGTWSRLYGNDYAGNYGDFLITGWYPRSYSNHLLLGVGFAGTVLMCKQWIGAEPLLDCTTTRATAASAQLRNGTIVLAEDDDYRMVEPWSETMPQPEFKYVEGSFGLRFPDGRETSLTGDPGYSTQFVVAEAHRNAAWAVTATETDTGWRMYLQRYEG